MDPSIPWIKWEVSAQPSCCLLCHAALALCFSHPLLVQKYPIRFSPPQDSFVFCFLCGLFSGFTGIPAWKVKAQYMNLLAYSHCLFPFSLLHTSKNLNFDFLFSHRIPFLGVLILALLLHACDWQINIEKVTHIEMQNRRACW